jgi:hypothetical protein
MHVGHEPLSADEGWTCFYFPATEEDGWHWDVEHLARSLYSAFRLIQRMP